MAALSWPTGRVSQPGGKPEKSSRKSSAAPTGAQHPTSARSPTSRHAIREPVAQSEAIENSFLYTRELVKIFRIEHLAESRVGMPTGRSSHLLLQIGSEQLVSATPSNARTRFPS